MTWIVGYFLIGIFVSVMFEMYTKANNHWYRPNMTSIFVSAVLWPICVYSLVLDIKNG